MAEDKRFYWIKLKDTFKLGAYLPLKEVYCIVTDELLRLCKNANEKELGIIPF